MNWSKAKTILILALIITDVFLILAYGDFGFTGGGFKDNKALADFLAQKGIFVNAAIIPVKHDDMPVLFVQNEDGCTDRMRALLSESSLQKVTGGKDEDYMKAADSFIKSSGPGFESAVFKSVERSGDEVLVTYKNVIRGITIEKSDMTCVFKGGILADVNCAWLKAVNFNNKKQKTISAAQGLLLFMMQNEGKKDIHIDSMDMIYWLDDSGIDIETAVSADTALPVWKIVYDGGEVSYIDAFDHQ